MTAPPNPWVGCVIVSATGQLIGAGYHQQAGEPHAEVCTLKPMFVALFMTRDVM